MFKKLANDTKLEGIINTEEEYGNVKENLRMLRTGIVQIGLN